MPYQPKDTFKVLAEDIKSTGQSRKLTVRDLLSYFQQLRRSDRVVRWIRGNSEKFGVVVTAADIGQQFISLAEPFLILEQVENHVRSLLDDKFTKEQLGRCCILPIRNGTLKPIRRCIRLLQNPDHWGRLGLKMDRATFTKRLDEIREIRNDVMHFHPDGISDHDKKRF